MFTNYSIATLVVVEICWIDDKSTGGEALRTLGLALAGALIEPDKIERAPCTVTTVKWAESPNPTYTGVLEKDMEKKTQRNYTGRLWSFSQSSQ